MDKNKLFQEIFANLEKLAKAYEAYPEMYMMILEQKARVLKIAAAEIGLHIDEEE